MKKNILLLCFLIIIQLIIGYFIFNNRDIYIFNNTKNKLEYTSLFSLDKLTLNNLSFVISDSKNNIYTIDNSEERVTKLDSNYKIQWVINLKSVFANSYENYRGVIVDNFGNVYVRTVIFNSLGYYVEEEQIQKYDSKGKFQKIIYSQTYEEKNSNRVGFLKMAIIKDENLYFYDISNNEIAVKSVDLNGDRYKTIENIKVPKENYIFQVSGIENGKMFYVTKTGQIFRVNEAGNSELVYPTKTNEMVSKSLPRLVDRDEAGNLFFIDMNAKRIAKLDLTDLSNPKTVFFMEDILDNNIKLPYADSIRLGNNSNILLASNNHIIEIKANKVVSKVRAVYYMDKEYFIRLALWFLPFVGILLFILTLCFVYYKMMKKRVSLLLKQVFAFLPILLLIIILFVMIYQNLAKENYSKTREELKLLAHIGANKISVDNINSINKPLDFMGDYYQKLNDEVHSLYEGNPNIDQQPFYGDIFKLENGEIYVCSAYENSNAPYTPVYSSNYEYINVLKTVAKSGIIGGGISFDSTGQWAYAVAPIYDKGGKIIALFETGSNIDYFTQDAKKYLKITFEISIPIILIMIIVFLAITYNSMRPIQEVKRAAEEIASGKWETEVSVNSMDEIADLGKGFNVMSKYVRDYIIQITELSEACYKFVPQQYMTILGKKSILDMNLGDQIKCEMSVLILNIREFFTFSETMTPEENFTFINAFLKEISPLIGNNNGFIDKFLGAGIIALFPEKETSIHAALNITKRLQEFNEDLRNKGKNQVNIGIGIHSGPLMLGIIGDTRRLVGTVISDTVNLAITLEKISQKLGVNTLVTQEVINDISDRNIYQYRFLGEVRLEGKDEIVRIYDFYEGDETDIKKYKIKTQRIFEEGIKFYQHKEFSDARNRFLEVIKVNNKDEAAKIYFFLCDKYYRNSDIKDWKGILIL